MFGNPSLVTRIAIGKGIGFVVGQIGFISLPFFLPDARWQLRRGILLWSTTVGPIIGVFGVFSRRQQRQNRRCQRFRLTRRKLLPS